MEDWNNMKDTRLKMDIKIVARFSHRNPVVLFRCIKYSSLDNEALASIYKVDLNLVERIKEN